MPTAAQVADTMAWLLSDGAARITGQVIAVDGGYHHSAALGQVSR